MFEAIRTFVENHITGGSDGIRDLVILFFIAICALEMYYVTRALLRLIERIVLRTPTSWDDDLFNSRFLGAVSQLSPALVVKWMLPGFFGGDYGWLGSATSIYIVGAVVWILIVFIQNVYNGISHRPSLRAYAVKGVFQMVQLVLICVAVVYSVSIMVGKSPVAILTALGASAAVLMLVFKDTILGLVASVQLTANKMIQRGDWIVCEKHDADGEVVDISLTTVKVRNWDNSITTIPPYVLISESFRNYEPMRFSGGRRVCRSILIDANSVGFCSSAQLEGLREQGWLHGIGIEEAARVVNLQLLRRYLEYWLMHDSRVNSDMVVMARQMPPTPQGLPLQLYFFCREVRWKQFEAVQSDIFDHIYAVIGLFGLRIFQSPAGADFAKTTDHDSNR